MLQQRLCRELTTWQKLSNHPNIAHFFGLTPGIGRLPCLVLLHFERSYAFEYVPKDPNAEVLQVGLSMVLCYMHGQNAPITHGKLRGVSPLNNFIMFFKL